MKIGGLIKFSLVDYPGKVSAIVFAQGCNFRCSYCHNPELIARENKKQEIPEEEVFEFLKKRSGHLQGVVVSGGEPTLQEGIIAFLDRLKRLGYLVKLDTNGSNPKMLKKLIFIRLVNYIAMDIKAPLWKYRDIVGVDVDTEAIKESIEIIKNCGLRHQFRTTLVKPLCSGEDIPKIVSLIGNEENYKINPFKADAKILDKNLLNKTHYTENEINLLKEKWEFQKA